MDRHIRSHAHSSGKSPHHRQLYQSQPVRINKRNHFAVTEVKCLVHVPETPKIRSFHDVIQTMLNQVARMNEMDEDW